MPNRRGGQYRTNAVPITLPFGRVPHTRLSSELTRLSPSMKYALPGTVLAGTRVRSSAISYLTRIPGDAGLNALEELLRTEQEDRFVHQTLHQFDDVEIVHKRVRQLHEGPGQLGFSSCHRSSLRVLERVTCGAG